MNLQCLQWQWSLATILKLVVGKHPTSPIVNILSNFVISQQTHIKKVLQSGNLIPERGVAYLPFKTHRYYVELYYTIEILSFVFRHHGLMNPSFHKEIEEIFELVCKSTLKMFSSVFNPITTSTPISSFEKFLQKCNEIKELKTSDSKKTFAKDSIYTENTRSFYYNQVEQSDTNLFNLSIQNSIHQIVLSCLTLVLVHLSNSNLKN